MDHADELAQLGQEAVGAFDSLLERAQAEHPPERPLACRAGCSHCCYQPEISVTAIEVFRIADFVIEQFSDKEVENLVNTLSDGAKPSPPPDPASWSLIACPLLRDGACSVYAVRPLVCRGANSYEVSDCERAREQNRRHPTIRNYGPQERAALLTIEALRQGMADARREAALLDLAPALAIALSNPVAKQRWQNGESVFATARSILSHC